MNTLRLEEVTPKEMPKPSSGRRTHVERIIIDALFASGGDVSEANRMLMDARAHRANWYDENLAAADDFLFSFHLRHVKGYSAPMARLIAGLYEAGKLFGLVGETSGGPVSPPSWAQLQWMLAGSNRDQLHGLCTPY